MAQIINGTGDIKVMNDKGETKWFCKRIVEDKQLMKSMKYEVVEAPDSFPPSEHILDVKNYLDSEKFGTSKQYENEVLNKPENIEPKEVSNNENAKRPYKSRK